MLDAIAGTVVSFFIILGGYETIYAKLEKDHLVESVQGKLGLTEKGRKELKMLAEKQVTYITWPKRKFMNARKIDWFAEGL